MTLWGFLTEHHRLLKISLAYNVGLRSVHLDRFPFYFLGNSNQFFCRVTLAVLGSRIEASNVARVHLGDVLIL